MSVVVVTAQQKPSSVLGSVEMHGTSIYNIPRYYESRYYTANAGHNIKYKLNNNVQQNRGTCA